MNKLRYRRLGAFLFWGAYQLVADAQYQSSVYGYKATGDQYTINPDGLVEINRWFAWDGPTNAIKTKSFVAGSCVHDVFCDAIDKGLLPKEAQPLADKEMYKINSAQGMNRFRRWFTYRAVRIYQEHKKKPCKEKIHEVEL